MPDSLVAPLGDQGSYRRQRSAAGAFVRFLEHHSCIYNLVRQRWAGVVRRLSKGSDLFNLEAVLGREHPEASAVLCVEHYPPLIERRMRLTESLLVGMRDLCAEKGVGFAVSIIPAGFQVLEAKRERYCVLPVIFHDERYVPGRGQRELSGMCRRNGIPVLDLLPAFEAEADDSYYFRWDPHLSARGHILVAEQLARFLRDEGLLARSHSAARRLDSRKAARSTASGATSDNGAPVRGCSNAMR
jgi:hypothetical protein